MRSKGKDVIMSRIEKLVGVLFILVAIASTQGCAAFRPLKGIPARYLPNEYRAVSRANQRTIDLSLLGMKPSTQHIVGRGDVLGIYVEGVLGVLGQAPPVNIPFQADAVPTIGYPLQVRDDGTISMPYVGSIDVRGMTIRQVEEHLRTMMIQRKILKQGKDKIIVTLQKARQIRVLVMRQESPQIGGTQTLQLGAVNLGDLKRGTGQVVNLPIGENDVLHALARTGGLPGTSASNVIYVIRRKRHVVSTPASSPVPYQAPAIMNSPMQAPQLAVPPTPVSSLQYEANEGSNIVQVGYRDGNQFPAVQQQQVQQQYAPQEYAQQQYTSQQYTDPRYIQQQYAQYEETTGVAAPQFMNASLQQPIDAYQTAYQGGIPSAVSPVEVPSSPTGSDLRMQSDVSVPSVPTQPIFQPRNSQVAQPQIQQPQSTFPQSTFSQSNPISTPPSSSPYGSYRGNEIRNSYPQQAAPQAVQPPAGVNPNLYQQQYAQPAYSQPAYTEPMQQQLQPIAENQADWNQADLPDGFPMVGRGAEIIRIPVRLSPGEQINFTERDITLQSGDIVFIESRETEIYYTGGLLGGGQYTLPRDYDLDVLAAISIAQSPQQNVAQVGRAMGGASAVNGDVTISASDVIILRRLADGTQVPIKVDLYKALRHPEERVIIQPGDMVILQYKRGEAWAALFERHLLEGALFGLAAAQLNVASRLFLKTGSHACQSVEKSTFWRTWLRPHVVFRQSLISIYAFLMKFAA